MNPFPTTIKERWMRLSERYSIYLILLILTVAFSLLNRNFLSAANLANVSRQISVTTIVAFGETLLIICGLIDLSAGSVLALSGVLSVSTYVSSESLALAFFVAIATSVFCNLINGVVITRFQVPPFIATLAMQAVARGAALYYTKGQNILRLGRYSVFGQGSLGWIPTPVVFLLLALLVTWYLLNHTRLGRALYAIGGNQEAAVAAGINVVRSKMMVFFFHGIFVGVAAVLFMSRVNAGLPNGAIGYEFQALTSSIIGGTSFSGGIGSAGGTLAGAFIVGALNNVMNLMNVNSYLQQMFKGFIIALAVIYDIRSKNRRTRGLFSVLRWKRSQE